MNIKDLIKRIPFVKECLERVRYTKKVDLRKLPIKDRTSKLIDRYEQKIRDVSKFSILK